jgi:tRNA G37 N-methylase Trm5
MFSRGNISEKIRFGKLVQRNELILDMYAGIGYYTLPALVIGEARYVYACEWNPHAASFLQYNLDQNGVNNKARVLEGDSRVRVVEENVLDLDFDRVSLGLLPSSEGGWKTAVKALRKDNGGWLHIHANVPSHERDEWALWMCSELSRMYEEIYPDNSAKAWVLCQRIEKVKSFAPKVDHFVADVFIGPQLPKDVYVDSAICRVGIIDKSGTFIESSKDADPPSCALGNGVLDREWMM